jgi:hypothetical protein
MKRLSDEHLEEALFLAKKCELDPKFIQKLEFEFRQRTQKNKKETKPKVDKT